VHEAARSFEAAIAADAGLGEAYKGLADCKTLLGDLTGAFTAYRQAVDLADNDASFRIFLGNAHASLGQYDKALEAYTEALQIDPDCAEAFYNIGCAHTALGRLEEGTRAFLEAIKRQPVYAEAYNNMGCAYSQLGRHVEALEAYERAIALKPDLANAYDGRGHACVALGKHAEAADAFENVLLLAPEDMAAQHNVASAYLNLGRLDEAAGGYMRVLFKEGEDKDAHFGLGAVFCRRGQFAEAIEHLQHAEPFAEGRTYVLKCLVDAYLEEARYVDALDACEALARTLKEDSELLGRFGQAFLGLGRYCEAKEVLSRAIELNADYVEAHRLLGLTCLKTGEIEAALAEYEVLKALDNDAAHELYAVIESGESYSEERKT
jgi:tetratricopeptide (TPR) repeat protein